MRSYAEAGLEAAGLGVDTDHPTGAYGLYAEMGFAATNTTVLYARDRDSRAGVRGARRRARRAAPAD